MPDIKTAVSNAMNKMTNAYQSGDDETSSVAAGLRENAKNAEAVRPKLSAPAPKPTVSPADKVNPNSRYGDKPGEKRMDVKDALKPLGSFAKGTPSVPKTGIYKIHEGEQIVPATNDSSLEEAYRGVYLSHKLGFSKDGTPMTGFVTLAENKPPRECGNCKWFTGPGSCTHGLVKMDPRVPKNPDGTGRVDSKECCDNMQNR
jgi:hypothetical protein